MNSIITFDTHFFCTCFSGFLKIVMFLSIFCHRSGLLRLTELEEGSISIDGVDVAAVGLDALR